MTRDPDPAYDAETAGDDGQLPPRPRRWTHVGNDWRSLAVKLLLGGGTLALLLAYTGAIKDYTRTNEAVASLQVLLAEHSRVLKDRETDIREAAVLTTRFNAHLEKSGAEHARVEREIEKHDAQLRAIEREMFAIAKKRS